MKTVLPISSLQVNEKVARLNAVLTILSVIIFLSTSYKWIILILAADLFIRGFLQPNYSYYSFISKMLLGLFKADPVMIDSGPKIFAAKVGFIFCCLILALHIFDLITLSGITGACLIFFATLEAAFGFCVACKIYPYIYKMNK